MRDRWTLRAVATSIPVLLWAAAVGCGAVGELEPVEDLIDLGAAPPGVLLEQRGSVINVTGGPATIVAQQWVEDRDGVFVFPDDRKELPQTVAVGARYTFVVRFLSDDPGVYWGTLALDYQTAGGPVDRRVVIGVGAAATAKEGEDTDADGDGFTPEDGDCDDGDPQTYPGAEELCDGLDNDCDGSLPGDEEDADGDGYPVCAGDCADGNPAVHPGAAEGCDGLDTDCDGVVTDYEDLDGDGLSGCEGDCDDGDPAVHPGAAEDCDGVDDDCDGSVDEIDADGDGYLDGDCGGDDCADGDPAVHPDALEICNGIDDDCNGALGGGEADDDLDGWMICEGDCDDGDAAVHPDAVEACNGVDDDCDGAVDPPLSDGCDLYHTDADGDLFGNPIAPQCLCAADPPWETLDGSDCYDGNPTAYPGAPDFHHLDRGDGSFDYDCDTVQEKEFDAIGECGVNEWGVCYLIEAGWVNVIPACGATSSWLSNCNGIEWHCLNTLTVKTQKCR